MIIES